MDICTADEEIVKLLDVKDIEVIDPSECLEQINSNQSNHNGNCEKQDDADSTTKSNGIIPASTERRSDEPTELSFEKGMVTLWNCCVYIEISIPNSTTFMEMWIFVLARYRNR